MTSFIKSRLRQVARLTLLASTLFLVTACGNSSNDFVFTTNNGLVQILTNLTVTPDGSTLAQGADLQFSAAATDQSNNPFPLDANNVVWSATDGTGSATIDAATGLATGTTPGTVTITATVGAVRGSATLTVVSGTPQNPSLTLDTAELIFEQGTAPVAAFPGATLSDDQTNLNNGTILISTSNSSSNVLFDVTNPSDIGTVLGDGTGIVFVALDADATPAAITAFLQAVTVTSNPGTSAGTDDFTVAVTDGQDGSVEAVRSFLLLGSGALNLTVPGDFATIQAALNDVRDNGAPNSVITVASGDFQGEGTLALDQPNHAGLLLRGSNSGISAGVVPTGTTAPVRLAESQIQRINLTRAGVTLDGFEVVDGNGGRAIDLSSDADSFTAKNSVFSGTGAAGNFAIRNSAANLRPSDVTVTNNFFTGWTRAIFLEGGAGVNNITGLIVIGNIFDTNESAVQLGFYNNTVLINGNSFLNSGLDHLLTFLDAGTIIDVTGNAFEGTGAISSNAGGTVNAQSSWWGQPGGPLGPQTNGNVDSTNPLGADPF